MHAARPERRYFAGWNGPPVPAWVFLVRRTLTLGFDPFPLCVEPGSNRKARLHYREPKTAQKLRRSIFHPHTNVCERPAAKKLISSVQRNASTWAEEK